MAATESSVFFQGDLQAGISLALKEGKVVVAFVTDDGDQSKEWENEFTTNETLRSPLESRALVFRLQAGSEEAGFLTALFPVPKIPTVVIIQNAKLREYIANNATKEDFVRRLAASLDQVAAPTPAQEEASSNEASSQTAPQVAPQAVPPSAAHTTNNEEQQQTPQPQSQSQSQSNARVQAILAERAKRLEADKKAKEAQEKADRESRAKQRRGADEAGEGQASANIGAAERSYAESVRQRKVQAAEERKRILRRIEDDRRERKEREAQERQARLLLSGATQEDGGSTSQLASSSSVPLSTRGRGGVGKGGEYCNLQVRLFDGSTLRARFKSDATLANEVRKWIDEERTDDNAPYTFRVLLTPLPNKPVDSTEEIKSLLSLGLAPSATLVLVRAKYASAYAGADHGGIVGKSFTYTISFFSAIFSFLFGGIINMFFGRRGGAQQSAQEEIPLRDLGASSRIRGFQNPNDRRDQQLYNGNSLNFEPRRDEDEDGGST
ncbi:hypothetical protein GGR53DRAFT_485194 [Hypoxylon sp. FL1150]|nr:hypothetical protein GGR53DRAFT_485194 [Hypoxylon sp. FL1150]